MPTPAAPSDQILARRAGLGDRQAFARIVTRHGAGLYRYAYRLLPEQSAVEEVIQETFLDAWKGLPGFRGESSLKTWLFTLTRHRVYAHLRSVRRDNRSDVDFDELVEQLPAVLADPAERQVDAGLVAALDVALRSLPARQRSAWILREVEDLSYAEIATVLGVSSGTVRGLLERARTGLAGILKEWR